MCQRSLKRNGWSLVLPVSVVLISVWGFPRLAAEEKPAPAPKPEAETATAKFLGPPEEWPKCGLSLAGVNLPAAGMDVHLLGTRLCILRIVEKDPMERQYWFPPALEDAQAIWKVCVAADLAALQVKPPPDKPGVQKTTLVLYNARGETREWVKPAEQGVAEFDRVAEALRALRAKIPPAVQPIEQRYFTDWEPPAVGLKAWGPEVQIIPVADFIPKLTDKLAATPEQVKKLHAAYERILEKWTQLNLRPAVAEAKRQVRQCKLNVLQNDGDQAVRAAFMNALVTVQEWQERYKPAVEFEMAKSRILRQEQYEVVRDVRPFTR